MVREKIVAISSLNLKMGGGWEGEWATALISKFIFVKL